MRHGEIHQCIRRTQRGILLGIIALALVACGTGKKELNAQRQALRRDLYKSQMEMYNMLDKVLHELGREYYVIQQEYQALGRDDLGRLAEKRAEKFHEGHQDLVDKRNELKGKIRRMEKKGLVPRVPATPPPRARPAPGQPFPAPK